MINAKTRALIFLKGLGKDEEEDEGEDNAEQACVTIPNKGTITSVASDLGRSSSLYGVINLSRNRAADCPAGILAAIEYSRL